jgi:hypothetical protein
MLLIKKHTMNSTSDLTTPLDIKKLNYVVAGTGRSGTVFMAKLLTSLGIPCGHETIFQCDGMEYNLARLQNSPEMPSLSVSMVAKRASINETWFGKNRRIEADSSYMAAPFLDHACLTETKIIHVVRHPLKVINSFVNGFGYFKSDSHKIDAVPNGWLYSPGEYHRFMYQYVPELYSDSLSPIEKASIYYVKWNEMIEKKSVGKEYYLHKLEDNLSGLFSFLGVQSKDHYNNIANKSEGLTDDMKIEDIYDLTIRDNLFKAGIKYGYF